MNDNQRVVTVSADMTCNADVTRAFEEAKIKMDGDPEIVCACAGKSIEIYHCMPYHYWHSSAGAAYPKLFVDHTVEDFEYMSKLNYLGQVYVAHVSIISLRE